MVPLALAGQVFLGHDVNMWRRCSATDPTFFTIFLQKALEDIRLCTNTWNPYTAYPSTG